MSTYHVIFLDPQVYEESEASEIVPESNSHNVTEKVSHSTATKGTGFAVET